MKYDDTYPYDTWVTMPYCKVDPQGNMASKPSDILPSGHSSCLVESTEKVVNGTSGSYLQRDDTVYSAQDGGRGVF